MEVIALYIYMSIWVYGYNSIITVNTTCFIVVTRSGRELILRIIRLESLYSIVLCL